MDKKKILVVEDDQVTCAMLDSILKKEGYDVVVAHNGRMALLLMKGMTPDVIITDVLMPEMNGFEFYKQVKKNGDTADIPFIVLTGHSEIGQTFNEMDIDEFISKPVDSVKLLDLVRKLATEGRDDKKILLGASKRSSLSNTKYFGLAVLGAVVLLFGALLYFLLANWNSRKMGAPVQHVDGQEVTVVEDEAAVAAILNE